MEFVSVESVSPKERRQARTREAILEAAREIVTEEGAGALSMRAIAQRIDYSPAGLYDYFDSKDEIIGAICAEGGQQLFAYMNAVDKAQPIADYLQALGHAYIRFATEQPDYFLLMFTSPAPPQNAGALVAQNEEDSAFGILLDALRRGVAEGVFQQRAGFDAQTMAYAAWAMVHGLAMLRLTHLHGAPMDFETGDREALANFGRGLMAAH